MTNDFDDQRREEGKSPQSSEKTEPAEAATATIDIEKIEQALEQKAKEAAEAHDRYVRTSADFENYRKRMQRDIADFKRYANEQMAQELLSVVDHLGLAIQHAAEAGDTGQGLRQGVELVHKQLLDVLEKFGITAFFPQGERFDPAKHDAVMQEVRDDLPENTVARVLQDGYIYHDKVLRHAKVSVSKNLQAESGAEKKDEPGGASGQ